MAILAFDKFSGVAPKLHPATLPGHLAQTALNVNLEARTLRSWRGLTDVKTGLTAADPSTIYRFGLDLASDTQYWFVWQDDVDVVKGPLVNDQTERTFYTGDGVPKWTNSSLALSSEPYPTDYRTLGVTAPTDAPTVEVTGTGSGTEESRVYVYTNVTAYGEESAPSPASEAVTVASSGHTVTISGFTAAPSGTGSTTARRIYRSVTSASGQTDYFYLKEIAVATTSTTDDVTDVGEPLETTEWETPPSDMFGITAMANGILVGFSGNDVCVSVPYVPYAWPSSYRLSTDYPIVGGKAIGNQTVVLTTGSPYLLAGTDASSLTLTKLEWPQACVAKRSIVNVGGAVLYASPDGLCGIDGTGALTNLTEALFSRDEWQALNPESMSGYLHNGRYVGFYDTGVVQGGFIFEPKEGDAAFSFIDTYATAGFADLIQDELFLKIGTAIQKWNASGSLASYTWLSGVTIVPQPTNFGAAQVFADAYPVTFKFYVDGVLKHTESVADANVFRLPSGFRGSRFEVELSGTEEVYRVRIATSPGELRAA